MKTTFNARTILWIIGVLQPVSALEICNYLAAVFDDVGKLSDEDAVHRFCLDQTNQGHLIRVTRKPDLFSLSLFGNQYLSEAHRKSRDKSRIYLLRDAYRSRFVTSREVDVTGLGGDAPSVDTRSNIKGTGTNAFGPAVPRDQMRWSRFSRQLSEQTGPSQTSRDATFPYFSFATAKQLALACRGSNENQTINFTSLGLMLGISPKLVQQIALNPPRHYRSFKLPKPNGGTRQIESPRVFLKVIQRFLVTAHPLVVLGFA